MKTYMYQCVVNKDCENKEHPSKAIPPMCCGKEMRKIYVPTNVIFKDKGFYSTDNKEKK